MHRRLIPFLVHTVIGIVVFAVIFQLATLRSVPLDTYREALREAARAEGCSVFTETSDGAVAKLSFLHQIRFPATPRKKKPAWGFPDGSTNHGIKNETEIFRTTAQRRQNRICYVVLQNDSADDQTVRSFGRRLSKQIPGIIVHVKK